MDNKIFHFIFGLDENFIDKPFAFFHYLCLKSCYLTQNKPKMWMHIIYEPKNNIWWDKAKEFFTIVKYEKLPDICYNCNSKVVYCREHQSDILRLLILKEYGGVYADIDTFFYKPFFPHFSDKTTVMGKEGEYHIEKDWYCINGLCNALIISDKTSEFLDIWLESYKSEYDNYDNHDWNKMSVRKPFHLYQQNEKLLHVEPVKTFHKYNWLSLFYEDISETNKFYARYMSDDGIMSKHMGESKIYNLLGSLTYEGIKSSNSLFFRMCKNVDGLL